MKMIKTLAAVTAAVLMSASAFAASTDKLYSASGYAVDNDSVYLMNLIDWSKLDFSQAYGLVNLSSEKTGNIGVAYKLSNGNTIHGYWSGNLWEENATNIFEALYGFGNMAVYASFERYTSGTKYLEAGFGDNLDAKKAFSVKGYYGWADERTYLNVTGNFAYNLSADGSSSSSKSSGKRARGKTAEEKPAATSKTAGGNLKRIGSYVIFYRYSNSDTDYSGTYFEIEPYYNLQFDLGSGVKFGSKGYMPVYFYGGDNKTDNSVGFDLYNGLTAQVKPTVTFAAGLATILPTFYFGDTDNGRFWNYFYMGCGIAVTSNVMLDIAANIHPTEDDNEGSNGESLDEIWKQEFAISFSVKL